jgi:3-phenylpropionate/trans-cinnamate dioxygenase ferredoxin subunit
MEPVDDVGGGALADGDVLSAWVDIGAAADLAPGVPLSAEVDGFAVVVVRCASGLYAVEDRCTHDGESFTGAEVEDCELVCPRHGSRFALQTGEALTPPAYEPLRTYAVREQAGRILLETPD